MSWIASYLWFASELQHEIREVAGKRVSGLLMIQWQAALKANE